MAKWISNKSERPFFCHLNWLNKLSRDLSDALLFAFHNDGFGGLKSVIIDQMAFGTVATFQCQYSKVYNRMPNHHKMQTIVSHFQF